MPLQLLVSSLARQFWLLCVAGEWLFADLVPVVDHPSLASWMLSVKFFLSISVCPLDFSTQAFEQMRVC